MRNHITPFAALLVGLLITLQSAAAKTIHVSPVGNDAWTGQSDQPNVDLTDGPVATLARARDIIRRWNMIEITSIENQEAAENYRHINDQTRVTHDNHLG
jgi:hypothetical protein